MNLSRESISEVFTLLKTTKPLIHCIAKSCDISDLNDGILNYSGTPFFSSSIEEVAEITTKSNGLVISLSTLDNNLILAMEKSLRAIRKLNISVILDISGANISTFRKNAAISFLEKYNLDIIKGTYEEILSLIDYDKSNGLDNYYFIRKQIRNFARLNRVTLMVSTDKSYVTDGFSEFYLSDDLEEFINNSNNSFVLTGMVAVGISIYKSREERVKSILIAMLSFAIAEKLAIEKVSINEDKMFLKNYLYDEISKIDVDKIINFGKLKYGFNH